MSAPVAHACCHHVGVTAAEGDPDRRLALVRRPGPLLEHGLVTHIDRLAVDVPLAHAQWETYRATLERCGWPTLEVQPADDCPDAVFVEDPVVVFGREAVLARSGAPSRRRETDALATLLVDLGCAVSSIVEPGTLDGGDVLKVGKTVYVGLTDRTNADGIRQLASLVEPQGIEVVTVPTTKVLHLKSAVTALPDGTVIGYPPLVDDLAAFPSFMGMPEEAGAHVVLLDERRLLMSSAAPRSADLLSARGLEPVLVDISEFEKLEGCVTCLSVRLRSL
jgi:dimethylargininase